MPVIELHNRYKKLVDLRSNWENHWQEIADYVLPKRADIIKQRTRGDKRTEQIYDGTALHALNLLSSSLHGMLTNAATPWFSLRYKDPNLATDENNEWLEAANQAMEQARKDGRLGGSLEADITLYANDALQNDLAKLLRLQ